MARRVPAEIPTDIELQDGDVVEQSVVLRIVEFYEQRIRPHTKAEKLGTFRTLKRTFEAGITPKQIWTAMKHYEADPLRQKANDLAYIKTMRSFFSAKNIEQWQQPRVLPKRPTDPAEELLTKLNDFAAIPSVTPVRQPPQPVSKVEEHEDDFFQL